MEQTKNRLFSLDALRGLDIFFLVALGPCLRVVGETWHWPDWYVRQFHHLHWEGLTLWDLIMPLFLFVSGAAVPFAMKRRLDENGRPTGAFWKHLGIRFLFLWVLGMVLQCELLSFDPSRMTLYFNTLQAIAVGFVVASLVCLSPRRFLLLCILPFALLALYGILLVVGGDMTPDGNLSIRLEMKILHMFLPADSIRFQPKTYNGYAYFLPTMAMLAISLFGAQVTCFLRSSMKEAKKGLLMFVYGLALVLVSFGLQALGLPAVKKIWTPSFVCLSVGWCLILWSVLYVMTDVLRIRRGFGLLMLFGQCSLLAYVFGVKFRWCFIQFAKITCCGTARVFGEDKQMLVEVIVHSAALGVFLWIYKRMRDAEREVSSLKGSAR